MTSTTITLANDCHNTEAHIRVGDDGQVTASQVRRAERKLCGMDDCHCGTIRGEQDYCVDEGYDDDGHTIWHVRPASSSPRGLG